MGQRSFGVSGLQLWPVDGDNGCPGQDLFFRAMIIVYSPFSNVRPETGLGVEEDNS